MRFSSLPLPFSSIVVVVVVVAACSDASTPSSRSSVTSGSSSGLVGSASFKDDIVPILATNCALAACHSSKESNLGIHLTYEKEQIYAELKKSSPTAGFGSAKFVVAGKPEESLLMAKMDGTQAKLAACKGGCGTEMPPGELIARKERDIVRTWIKNGANDD